MSTILVTGGSGFIGSHAILQLLAAGHQVRTTVRSLKREGDVHHVEGGRVCRETAYRSSPPISNDAVVGGDRLLRVRVARGRLFPPNIPKHEDELIARA